MTGIMFDQGGGIPLLNLPRPRFAVLGDSLAEGQNIGVGISALSQAGGVATATSASHGLTVGDSIFVKGATQSGYNGGKIVTGTPSANTFTFAVDSATVSPATTATSIEARVEKTLYGSGFFPFFAGKFPGGLPLVGNYGISGQTSAEILARVGDAISSDADYIITSSGHNDILLVANPDLTSIYSNVVSTCAALLAAGKVPVLFTLEADGGAAGVTAAARRNIMEMNRMLRAYAASTQGVILVEVHGALVNPTNTNGVAAANYHQADLLHLNCNGARRVADAIYTAVASRIQVPDMAPNSTADTDGQFASNPLFLGTGGYSSGVTATAVPASCVAVRWAGTGTWVSNVAARVAGTDGDAFGQNHTLSTSNAAVTDVVQFGQASLLSPVQAAGASKIFGVAHLQIDNPARVGSLFFGIQTKTSAGEQWSSFRWGAGMQTGMATPLSLWLKTPVCNVPSGCTEIGFYVLAQAGSTGAITIKLGRLGVFAV